MVEGKCLSFDGSKMTLSGWRTTLSGWILDVGLFACSSVFWIFLTESYGSRVFSGHSWTLKTLAF
jgi:hypothetical protein